MKMRQNREREIFRAQRDSTKPRQFDADLLREGNGLPMEVVAVLNVEQLLMAHNI